MRTHFLRDLRIDSAITTLEILQGFDFYKLSRITGITWNIQGDNCHQLSNPRLDIKIIYNRSKEDKIEVVLRFSGVVRCKLPELSETTYLSEIEIEDVKNAQLEGVHYIIESFGTTEFRIECQNFEVTVQ